MDKNNKAGNPRLVCQDIVKVYPTKTRGISAAPLRGLSLRIEGPEVIVVFGPSGSGKTTLINILAGYDRPTAGIVEVDNILLNSISKNRLIQYWGSVVGVVHQNYHENMFLNLSVEEQVEMPLLLTGKSKRTREKTVKKLLEFVCLTERSKAKLRNLSGGELQRTAICVALANQPRLILADEPTGNLDEGSTLQIFSLLRKSATEWDSAVVLVTHNSLARQFADKAYYLKDGKLVEQVT